MRRRAYLTMVSAGSVVGLTGCIGVFEDDAIELAGIRISNSRYEEYSVDIRVEIEGEVVSTERYTVPARDGQVVGSVQANCTWSSGQHDEFAVSARRNQEEGWEKISSAEVEHEDCVWAAVRIEDPGDRFYLLLRDCGGSLAGEGC